MQQLRQEVQVWMWVCGMKPLAALVRLLKRDFWMKARSMRLSCVFWSWNLKKACLNILIWRKTCFHRRKPAFRRYPLHWRGNLRCFWKTKRRYFRLQRSTKKWLSSAIMPQTATVCSVTIHHRFRKTNASQFCREWSRKRRKAWRFPMPWEVVFQKQMRMRRQKHWHLQKKAMWSWLLSEAPLHALAGQYLMQMEQHRREPAAARWIAAKEWIPQRFIFLRHRRSW